MSESSSRREGFEQLAAAWRLAAWEWFFALHFVSAYRAWRMARWHDRMAREAQS